MLKSSIFLPLYTKPPPQTLYLGKVSLSIIIVEMPFLAKLYAANAPEGPVPMIATS